MDPIIRQHLENLYSSDAELRYKSFLFLLNEAEQPVDWIIPAWDDLLALLHGDNHQRSMAAQLISSLAKSDPARMLAALDKLIQVTRDERFVTARHTLQSLWKVGIANDELKEEILHRLGDRFRECSTEKNCTLIRYDILVVFRKMYDHVQDKKIKAVAVNLIESEEDPRYKKKYMGVWKDVITANKQLL